MTENQETEFKVQYTEDIKKEVIAFLNTNDGSIYIGIDNNGNVKGIDNSDIVMQQAASAIKNAIRPDCTQFIKINAIEIDGKSVVRINVIKGTHQPYYLGEKGVKPSGVFIRLGSSTVQAQEEQIRELLKNADTEKYEEKISGRQDLTFFYADNIFKEKEIPFSNNNKQTLGLLTKEGFYTNLAFLLSEQCEYSIKCAIFEGTTKNIFKDRKEFSGSLFKQIEDVLDYLNVYNKTHSVIGGKTREDKRDYPETAIREALLNAVIHRDYSFSGSILVSLFDDRLEIVSLGGLVKGISKDAILIGISETRNKKLADVFYRLKYIEAYGTGIPRIMENYADFAVKPQINVFDNTFQIIIPNQTYVRPQKTETLSERCQRLVNEYLDNHEYITKEDAAVLFGTQPPRAYVILEDLVSRGLFFTSKIGRKKIYMGKKN